MGREIDRLNKCNQGIKTITRSLKIEGLADVKKLKDDVQSRVNKVSEELKNSKKEVLKNTLNLTDIKSRVKLMPDPEKIIAKRIIIELKGGDKYNLFTNQ